MAIFYADNVQVAKCTCTLADTNCTGYATFILPPYISIDAEILLQNNVGATNSLKRSFGKSELSVV